MPCIQGEELALWGNEWKQYVKLDYTLLNPIHQMWALPIVRLEAYVITNLNICRSSKGLEG
jgi:hypothetical protein